jgi:raffinose/stachyose/melibiose transport system substrate-binding protein
MKSRTRLSFALTALTAGSLVLAGCSNDPGGSSAKNTVTFFATTDYRDAYQVIIKDFEAEHPGVKVKVTFVGGNDMEATENTQLAAGNAADVLAVQPGTGGNLISVGSLTKGGHLADLSNESWAKEVPAALKPVVAVGSKTYMYPGVLQPLGAFYNTQAMQAAKLDVPSTWTQLLAFCRNAKSAGKVAFSLGLQDQWVAQLVPYALTPTLVYGPDPGWNTKLVAGQTTFPTSPWLKVEQQYLDMRDAGCFSASPNGISFDNTLPPVAKGDALAVVQVGGIFGNLQGQNKGATYSLTPLPATDDTSQTRMGASPGIGLGLNAKAKNPKLALEFINYVAQPAVINKFAMTLGGVAPAIGNAEFKAPPLLATFNNYLEAGKVSTFPDTGWPNPEIQNAHLVGIQNMFLGSETPKGVLNDMQSAVKH